MKLPGKRALLAITAATALVMSGAPSTFADDATPVAAPEEATQEVVEVDEPAPEENNDVQDPPSTEPDAESATNSTDDEGTSDIATPEEDAGDSTSDGGTDGSNPDSDGSEPPEGNAPDESEDETSENGDATEEEVTEEVTEPEEDTATKDAPEQTIIAQPANTKQGASTAALQAEPSPSISFNARTVCGVTLYEGEYVFVWIIDIFDVVTENVDESNLFFTPPDGDEFDPTESGDLEVFAIYQGEQLGDGVFLEDAFNESNCPQPGTVTRYFNQTCNVVDGEFVYTLGAEPKGGQSDSVSNIRYSPEVGATQNTPFSSVTITFDDVNYGNDLTQVVNEVPLVGDDCEIVQAEPSISFNARTVCGVTLYEGEYVFVWIIDIFDVVTENVDESNLFFTPPDGDEFDPTESGDLEVFAIYQGEQLGDGVFLEDAFNESNCPQPAAFDPTVSQVCSVVDGASTYTLQGSIGDTDVTNVVFTPALGSSSATPFTSVSVAADDPNFGAIDPIVLDVPLAGEGCPDPETDPDPDPDPEPTPTPDPDPETAPPTPTPTPELPATGSDSVTNMVLIALGLLLLGGTLILGSTRRRFGNLPHHS